MLATAAGPTGLPLGPAWAYEVKWDGIRLLVDITEGGLTLRSRAGRDLTVAFPEFADLAGAHPDVLLDVEAVVLEAGRPSFARVVERVHITDATRAAQLAARAPVTLFAFDALRLYGVDLTARPWHERRASLERLQIPDLRGDGPAWQVSPVYDDGAALLAATQANGLEGVVAKRRASRYTPGRRSPDWVKLAHRTSTTCWVGGWRPEVGDDRRIGALLVGIRRGDGSLRFMGRVGSGMTAALEAELRRRVMGNPSATSPFADEVPREDAHGAYWCDPSFAVEVRHLGHGLPPEGARLRAPVLRGIRPEADLDDMDFAAQMRRDSGSEEP